jgi:hypothetical protein
MLGSFFLEELNMGRMDVESFKNIWDFFSHITMKQNVFFIYCDLCAKFALEFLSYLFDVDFEFSKTAYFSLTVKLIINKKYLNFTLINFLSSL